MMCGKKYEDDNNTSVEPGGIELVSDVCVF